MYLQREPHFGVMRNRQSYQIRNTDKKFGEYMDNIHFWFLDITKPRLINISVCALFVISFSKEDTARQVFVAKRSY